MVGPYQQQHLRIKDASRKVADKVLRSDSLIFTFLRSVVSSQAASWSDMIVRMVMFAFVLQSVDPFYRSNISVACGALVGGIVNCTINYRFTFHAAGQSVKAVIVKYAPRLDRKPAPQHRQWHHLHLRRRFRAGSS